LFKPYPKQYQKWRDDSIKVAREHLEKGENILLLNLDIKDFFYSVRIDRREIETHLSDRIEFKSMNNLYLIFGKIHEIFTEKLSMQYKSPYDFSKEVYDSGGRIQFYILPIGLLSSFILANDYLKSFDDRIIKKSKPVYYGRYVDDILMVIANPQIPNDKIEDSIDELNFNFASYKKWLTESELHDSTEMLSEEKHENLSDLEQFVLRNFYPVITLIDTPDFLSSSPVDKNKKDRLFKLNGFPRLYCQSEKTVLHYFDKDESSLVIDKLKRDIEEKSSEFRNYRDAEGEEHFEESAYHLLYDGSNGKIRTLKDYKEDKFGLSVYLSKRIFNALRRADKISDKEADKIVIFFRGCNALSLYSLWERVFVFLLVNNKAHEYVKFYLNCAEAIKGINCSEKSFISALEYQENVFEYLDCAHELTLSLHPLFISEINKVKQTFEFSFNSLKTDHPFFSQKFNPTDETSFFIRRFRDSNLLRHHYTTQPLLTYTKINKNPNRNFTKLKIDF
jgi:hypothetical protein